MKRLISSFIVFTFIVALFSGCQTSGKVASGSTSTAAFSTAKQETTVPEKKAEPVELTVSYWFDDNNQYFPAVQTELKKVDPNVTLKFEKYNGTDYGNIISTKLMAGEADDIVYNQDAKKFGKAGYFLDLTNEPYVANILDAPKKVVSYNGKVYGVPYVVNTFGVFYNKKLFDEMQLSVPNTWDEFIALCDKIKAAGKVPFITGGKDVWPMGSIITAMAANSTFGKNMNWPKDLFDGKITMADTGLKEGLERFALLGKNGYYSKNVLGVSMDQSIQDFGDGKGFMCIHGSWWPSVVDAKFKDIQMGFFPVPPFNGEKAVMDVGPDIFLSINSKSKNIDAAKEFALTALKPEILGVYMKNSAIPAMKGVDPTFEDQAMKDIVDYLGKLDTCGNYDWYIGPLANDIYTKDLAAMVTGSKGVSDTLISDMEKAYAKDKDTNVAPNID